MVKLLAASLKVVLTLVVCYGAYMAARNGIADWYYRNRTDKSGIEKAIQWAPENPEYHAALARSLQRSLVQESPEKVQQLFEKATQLGPTRTRYWTELGDVYELSGQEDAAVRAYERAKKLFPLSPDVNWRLGNFYIRTGRISEALSTLQKAIIGNSGLRLASFDLAWRAGASEDLILGSLIPPDAEAYLLYNQYLVTIGRLDAAVSAWNRLVALGLTIRHAGAFGYLDALIQARRVDEAGKAWQELLDRGPARLRESNGGESLVTNGNFEADILNGGFDWRVTAVDGAQVSIDTNSAMDGARSLQVLFDGKQNLLYGHILQYVRVKPNTLYHFSGYMRAEAISTDSGPRFEVMDAYSTEKLFMATESLRGTTGWTPLRMEIRTGPDTTLIVVKIARLKSQKFDNQIAGKAWIDRVSLVLAQ
ncbi:MAG: hypothetical protein A3F68_00970 [Acidobacteria bacterium RIFCSPLOWO2_12_FULL_54_10]|nr:MAG: hypothetical protein A3F68_00970 [Acidobacteria bacterium RIFCSPLOWO2_12_FULL_54_10]